MARRRPARLTRTKRIDSPRLRGYRYRPASGGRLSRRRTIAIIRNRLHYISPGATVWIRARGGVPEYRNRWWSSAPLDADEMNAAGDDELADMLRDLEDPWELDITSEK